MPQKFLLGLIGAPIAHSAAPAMHEAAAFALGLSCHYQLIEIAGAGREELRGLLDNLRSRGFAGVSVTYPYKEAVIEWLDRLAPEAQAIGAVNTVVVRDGRLIGHNTDTTGFATAVAPRLAGARAEKLAAMLRGRVTVADSVEAALNGADGLVNATPVGMLPDQGMPVPERLLHGRLRVADAVYWPLMTPLLTAAEARGARIMSGRELAIHQAVDAFKLFTGHAPSASVMADAFDAVMAKRAAT
jgi:shikimate dehydrogenase